MNCAWCDEPIENLADAEVTTLGPFSPPMHPECLIRMVAGSVLHQLGLCTCYDPSYVTIMGDPEDSMTRRGAAIAAAEFFAKRREISGQRCNGAGMELFEGLRTSTGAPGTTRRQSGVTDLDR